MNRRLLEENGLEDAIADPTLYAWVVREGAGPVIRAGVERMPPEGSGWTDREVVRQLQGQLEGVWIRHISLGAGMPLDEDGTRVNLVFITPRDTTDVSDLVAAKGTRVFGLTRSSGELERAAGVISPRSVAAEGIRVFGLTRSSGEMETTAGTISPRRTEPKASLGQTPRGATPVQDRASGTISGVITDAEGRILPGASVTLQPLRRGTTTNAEGRFTLINIPPGTYSLVGVRPNTGRMIRRQVEVEGGERQTIHIVF